MLERDLIQMNIAFFPNIATPIINMILSLGPEVKFYTWSSLTFEM